MAPLIALLAGTALARIAGLLGVDALDGWHPALRVGLALMFVLTGVAHFASRRSRPHRDGPAVAAPARPAGHRHRRTGTRPARSRCCSRPPRARRRPGWHC